jgi:hypothetical protein
MQHVAKGVKSLRSPDVSFDIVVIEPEIIQRLNLPLIG